MSWVQLRGRHDARYYLPRYLRLEEEVARHATGRLGGYSRGMAGGATPKAEEKERYYSDDPEAGVPFIRVQNLTVLGELALDDVKRINRETHQGLLARSQVGPDDLLTKITGVGRMAVSSVPPAGFEGNINQHLVRMKTCSRETSEVLAAYLNTDVAETLATRRATGGTRPALDYSALRSIPIIFDERILPVAKAAADAHKARVGEADTLLASIDDYLLGELGITLPQQPGGGGRAFSVNFHDLVGWRLDPLYHAFDLWQAIEQSGLPYARLGSVCLSVRSGFAAGAQHQSEDEDSILQVRPTNIGADRRLKFDRNVYISSDVAIHRPREILQPGEILFNNTNSQILVGKTTYFDMVDRLYTCSNHITRLTVDPAKALPQFIAGVLNLYQRRKAFFSICTNWNNQSGIGGDLLKSVILPLPNLAVQHRIIEHIETVFSQAESLRTEAAAEFDAAKRQIETIMLRRTV